MNIGILLCGDVPEPLMDEFGGYANCLQQQLDLALYGSTAVWNLYQRHEIPQDVNACDLYIIGGSPFGVNDDCEWIQWLRSFIQAAFHAGKKLPGICFGHQVINHALGGEVERASKGWGLGTYEVTLFRDLGNIKRGENLSLIAIHQDQVVKPAPCLEVVAGSDFCPNYLTRYQDQVLTVQGHPEFNYPFFTALVKERQAKFSKAEMDRVLEQGPLHQDGVCFNKLTQRILFQG